MHSDFNANEFYCNWVYTFILFSISINFQIFYLNSYLILKPLICFQYLYGAIVISETGAKVISFLAQMKKELAQKSYSLAQMQNAGCTVIYSACVVKLSFFD